MCEITVENSSIRVGVGCARNSRLINELNEEKGHYLWESELDMCLLGLSALELVALSELGTKCTLDRGPGCAWQGGQHLFVKKSRHSGPREKGVRSVR